MGILGRRLSLLSVLALPVACGGSGSGGSPDLTGSFHVFAAQGDAAPAMDAVSRWGTGTSDGVELTLSVTSNLDGVIAGPEGRVYGLGVDSVGNVVLAAGADPALSGFVADDGAVVAAASVLAGDPPNILALVRPSSGADVSGLSGTYHFVFLALDDPASGRSVVGTVTLDGAGGGTLNAGSAINVDGDLDTSTLGSLAPYSVAADGRIDLTLSLGLTLEGSHDPSRELLVLGGSTTAGQSPATFFAVKSPASASVATFSGNYGIVGLAFDFSSPAMSSLGGRVVADGAGGGTAQGGTANSEGTIAATPAGPFTYTVAADGTLAVTAVGVTLRGAVSPSGDFAVLGGPVTAGAPPSVFLLVRR